MHELGFSRTFKALVRAVLASGVLEESVQDIVCPAFWDGVGPWLTRLAGNYREYMDKTDIEWVFSSPGLSKYRPLILPNHYRFQYHYSSFSQPSTYPPHYQPPRWPS